MSTYRFAAVKANAGVKVEVIVDVHVRSGQGLRHRQGQTGGTVFHLSFLIAVPGRITA
jgi:hypothetical protein